MPISGVNPTPRTTAVYASDPALPRRPQNLLPSRLLSFGRTRLALASSYRLLLSHPAPGSCRRSNVIDVRGLGGPFRFDPRVGASCDTPKPALCPGRASASTSSSDSGPFPPPSPPPLLTALFEGFSSTMDPSELLRLSPTASPSRLPVAARDRSCACGPQEVSQVPARSLLA